MSLRGMLCQTGALYAKRKVTQPTGVVTYVFNKIADNIPCRSVHLKNTFGATMGRMTAQATHLLYLDAGTHTVDTSMAFGVDGTIYGFEHVEPKFNRTRVHHYECLMFALESPQTTAR